MMQHATKCVEKNKMLRLALDELTGDTAPRETKLLWAGAPHIFPKFFISKTKTGWKSRNRFLFQVAAGSNEAREKKQAIRLGRQSLLLCPSSLFH